MGSNNGVYSNTPTLGDTGILGTAVRFNNGVTNESAGVSASQSFSIEENGNDTAFSVSVWVKHTSTAGFIVGKSNNTTSDYEWELSASSGTYRFFIYSQGSNSAIIRLIALTNVVLNEWTNIIATYDGSGTIEGCNIYINGAEDKDTDLSFVSGTYLGVSYTSSPLNIANDGNQLNPFNGTLDELCIWKNKELTPSEINDIYNGGLGLELV